MNLLLAMILALQPAAEPMRAIEIDMPAFEKALELAECMKGAQSTKRKEMRALKSLEARRERLQELCEIERRNSEIIDRLRAASPEATQQQLLEEHKNIVLLAMFHRRSSAHSDDDEAGVPND